MNETINYWESEEARDYYGLLDDDNYDEDYAMEGEE